MRALVAALVLGFAGCRRETPPPADAPVGSAKTAASAAPEAAARAWHVVATAPDPLALHAIDGGTFVHAGGFFAALDGASIHQQPRLLLGLASYGEVVRVDGQWPDAAYLTLLVTPKLTPWTTLRKEYRWYESHWSAAPNPLHDAPPVGITSWGDRTLALHREGGLASFLLVRAMADTPVPALPPSTESGCPQALRTRTLSLLGFRSGELLLLGEACGKAQAGAPAVVRWSKGATEGVVTLLPKTGAEVIAPLLAARSADDVTVAGRSGDGAYVAHFDGATWTSEPAPGIGPVVALSVAPDGAVWIATRTTVHRRARGAPLVAVAREGGGELDGVTTLVARSLDDAWITVDGSSGSELLSTAPSTPVLTIPDKKSFWEARASAGHAPATTACRDLFAQLSTVGKHGGYIPGDMPFLRETMRDHPELAGARFVLDDDGQELQLGAVVPSIEIGEKILALFAPRLGLASTRVSCHVPTIIRDVRSQ